MRAMCGGPPLQFQLLGRWGLGGLKFEASLGKKVNGIPSQPISQAQWYVLKIPAMRQSKDHGPRPAPGKNLKTISKK
jgi:hypothetical protein